MHFQGVYCDLDVAYRQATELCKVVLDHIPDDQHFHISTAFRELLNNAIIASNGINGQIAVDFFLGNDTLTLVIVNTGVRFYCDPDMVKMPDMTEEHGRGIPIARRCSDSLLYSRSTERKTRVTVWWDLRKRRRV